MFQFRLRTLLVVVAVAGILLAANANVSPAVRKWDIEAPWNYGALAGHVFLRGWPVPPWVFCEHRHMTYHMQAAPFLAVLLFDALVAAVTVYNCVFLVGWATGGRKTGKRPTRWRHGLPLLAGCATIVPVCWLAIVSPEYRRLVLLGSFAQQVAALLALPAFLAMAACTLARVANWRLQGRSPGTGSD